MSVIHQTTLVPGKIELVTAWLPRQPWYLGQGEPTLSKAGGFRLDDPAGAVGMEFLVVADLVDGDAVYYQVPLTYRDAPLDGAEHALVGTTEHGVLGTRWVYDGAHDPLVAAQLLALLQHQVEPQAQSVSNTTDPTVLAELDLPGGLTAVRVAVTDSAGGRPSLVVETIDAAGAPAGRVVIDLIRRLSTDPAESSGSDGSVAGSITADWQTPDGSAQRGRFAVVRLLDS